MRPMRRLTPMALLLALCPLAPTQAAVFVGVGVGGRPCYHGYYRPYYGYYPPIVVGVGLSPVYVAPTVVAQPVTVVQPIYAPPPATPPLAPPPLPTEQLRTPPILTPTGAPGAFAQPNSDVDRCLQQLGQADPKIRADAMIELGRLKAPQAVEPLKTALASDRSPVAREAAARGLGLIGTLSSLDALQLAAQADEDHDVRNSARFAADAIRSRLPR